MTLTGSARALVSLTLALSVAGEAKAIGGRLNAGQSSRARCEATRWLVKPQNGTPDDTALYVHAVPESTVRVRLSIGGRWAESRRGWGFSETTGARCTAGATCYFAQKLGSAAESGQNAGLPITGWSAAESFAAGSAAGVEVAAGRHVEFRLTGLSPDTLYNWTLECKAPTASDATWGPALLGDGIVRTLPAPGTGEFRALLTADFHFGPTIFAAMQTSTTDATDPTSGLCLATDVDPTNGITGPAYTPLTACDADADCAGKGSAKCSCPNPDSIADTVEDCDVNGIPDYLESVRRSEFSVAAIAKAAAGGSYHALLDLGDFANRHSDFGQTCLDSEGKVGPCVNLPASLTSDQTFSDRWDPELQDAVCIGGANAGEVCGDGGDCASGVCSTTTYPRTQLGVPLGQGNVEAQLGVKGKLGYADDELLLSENRMGEALNRIAPVTRLVSFLFKTGNHEGGALYGDAACGTGSTQHCRPPYTDGDAACNKPDDDSVSGANRIDPTCGGLSERSVSISNNERGHGINLVYPNPVALDHPSLEAYDQGSHVGYFIAGKACVVLVDEYVYTDGKDHAGEVLAAGTGFAAADCTDAGFPVPGCTAPGTGAQVSTTPQMPSTWNLGPQIAWIRDTVIPACAAAGAKTLVRLSHHMAGGIGQSTGNADYGRGTCPSTRRHCINATTKIEMKGPNARVPGIASGESIPCWGNFTAGANEGLSKWCDWVDDATFNQTGNCEAMDWTEPVDDRTDEGKLFDVIEAAIEAGSLDRAIHALGHDHLFTACPFHEATQFYFTAPAGGGGGVPWDNITNLETHKDFDANGIGDYFEAPYLAQASLLGLEWLKGGRDDGQLNGANPIRGWDGKGFITLAVHADGSATLTMREVPGADDCIGLNDPNCAARQSDDGKIVWTKELGP